MTEVVFVHDRYPFGGGETVTALVAKGLTDADSDVHVTVIAAHLDRKQAADTAGVTHMQAHSRQHRRTARRHRPRGRAYSTGGSSTRTAGIGTFAAPGMEDSIHTS